MHPDEKSRYIREIRKYYEEPGFWTVVAFVIGCIIANAAFDWPWWGILLAGGTCGAVTQMAITAMALPKNLESLNDDVIGFLHKKALQQKIIHRISWGAAGVIVLVLALLGYAIENGAKCKVSSVEVRPDVFIINGEPDAGYTIYAAISNGGKQGTIDINAVLETSEGKFTRRQSYTLAENGAGTFKFGFHEPTVNATNVQGRVSCSP